MRIPSPHPIIVSFLVFFSVSTASAQGYFYGSKGARSDGRAGAVTAKADDISAVEYNPAGLARTDGTKVQLSNRFSYNYVSFSRDVTQDWGSSPPGQLTAFKTVTNQLPVQGVDPLLGVSSDFGLQDWGFGLAVYAPPGVGRMEFPVGQAPGESADSGLDGGQRYMMVKREVMMLTYAASVAWKFKELFGLGATMQWIHVPQLSYSLVVNGYPFQGSNSNVSSQFDILSTVSGSDPFTFNAVLGSWVRPLPFLELALSGQVIPSQIETNSTISMEPLNLSNQVILTRDGQPANDVQLVLPLPMTARFGARFFTDVFDVELDLTYQTWSRVESFDVHTNGLDVEIVGIGSAAVNDVIINKRWKDTLRVALGSDIHILPKLLTGRAGLAYETAVADPVYSHVDFATGQFMTGALGGSLHFGKLELALAYSYRHQLPVSTSEADGQVFQEVPASVCDVATNPGSCHPSLVAQGKNRATVNGGSYQAFNHALSLDVIYGF